MQIRFGVAMLASAVVGFTAGAAFGWWGLLITIPVSAVLGHLSAND